MTLELFDRLIIAAAPAGKDPSVVGGAKDGVDSQSACASFLIMEFRTNPVLASQKLQLRLQRPTITAEISFMLAVTKFFVPNLALSGAKPIPFQTLDLQLGGETFKADDDLWLCPETRLLADAVDTESYTYDGQVSMKIAQWESPIDDSQLACLCPSRLGLYVIRGSSVQSTACTCLIAA